MIHQTRGPRGCKGGGVCERPHTPPPLHPVGSSANLSQPMSTQLIDLTQTAAAELGLRPAQVAAAAKLLDGGATVPFVARYRKEPRILSRRFSNSLRRVSWSRTAVISTSSRNTVAPLRYRATKGTV